jgi:hypothetical protein
MMDVANPKVGGDGDPTTGDNGPKRQSTGNGALRNGRNARFELAAPLESMSAVRRLSAIKYVGVNPDTTRNMVP